MELGLEDTNEFSIVGDLWVGEYQSSSFAKSRLVGEFMWVDEDGDCL